MATEFFYHGKLFKVQYDPNDNSGLGSILEIVTRNDYKLDRFVGKKNKIFVDIGANLGIATIIMAKLNPASIIYSFEPFKKVYDMLIQNIKINNLTNVRAYNLAVSNSTNKQLMLTVLNQMSGASSTYSVPEKFSEYWQATNLAQPTPNKQIINCISFDDFLTQCKINEVFLLKIDCEGAEFDIIYDSRLFKNFIVKNIVGEFHDLQYNNITKNKSHELIAYCKEYINGIVNISVLTL